MNIVLYFFSFWLAVRRKGGGGGSKWSKASSQRLVMGGKEEVVAFSVDHFGWKMEGKLSKWAGSRVVVECRMYSTGTYLGR